jgi:oligopeptide transport system ATP-binding protein
MKDLRDKFGLIDLQIARNVAVVRQIATRIGGMCLGRLVEVAATDGLFESPRHPHT